MDKIEEYGLDSPSKMLPLILFEVADGSKRVQLSRLQINKMIRYFEYLSKSQDISFSHYKLGDVSYELSENLEVLVDYGLLDKTEHERYFLSDEGKEAGNELVHTVSKQNFGDMEKAYSTLKDLTDDELMLFMYKTIPETQEKSIVINKLIRDEVSLVQSIYNKGKISAAIALAWVSEEERDELDLAVSPEYIARLKARQKERTISSSNFLASGG